MQGCFRGSGLLSLAFFPTVLPTGSTVLLKFLVGLNSLGSLDGKQPDLDASKRGSLSYYWLGVRWHSIEEV